MASTDLTCKEFVEIVTEYLEGALPPEELARFTEHLSGCDGCGTYLEQIQQAIRWTGQLTEAQISEAARARLLEVFRLWKNEAGG